MLFRNAVLDGIRAGKVTLAFRRWARPTVKPGGSLKTSIGILFIESVDPITASDIGDEEARRAGALGRRELVAELAGSSGGTLYRIAFRLAGDDPRVALRDDVVMDAATLAVLRKKLSSLDRGTPWTVAAIRLIAAHPGRPAAELATDLGMEKLVAKRRIRALKELGLTESLVVGYRLSPRGEAFINDHQVSNSPNG